MKFSVHHESYQTNININERNVSPRKPKKNETGGIKGQNNGVLLLLHYHFDDNAFAHMSS